MNRWTSLEVLALSVLGASLGTLAYAVGSAPKSPATRLGLRGYKRARSLASSPLFAAIEPTMRFIAQRSYSLLSPVLRDRMEHEISMAGSVGGLLPEDLAALSVMSSLLAACLGSVCGYVYSSALLFGGLLGIAGLITPYSYIVTIGQDRRRSIGTSLPRVIDLLALSLGAGLDFPSAVRQIVERTGQRQGALYEELRLVLQDLRLGRTRRYALEQFAERAPCEAVRDLVGAVIQSEEQGTPLAEVLRIQASASRVQRSAGAEETAAKAANKLMLPLVLLFMCVLALIVGPIALRFSEQFP
jgi:tight adherence protein C